MGKEEWKDEKGFGVGAKEIEGVGFLLLIVDGCILGFGYMLF